MICEGQCADIFIRLCKGITVLFGGTASIIIFYLIFKHLNHYTNPNFQNKIIGKFQTVLIKTNLAVIILLIPFYSLNAIITTITAHTHVKSQILVVIRGLYEAILILSFFRLIIAYVCYKKEDGVRIERLLYLIV